MRINDDVTVLLCAVLRISAHKQELMVQVVEASAPRSAPECSPNREVIAHCRQLRSQDHSVWAPLLAQDGCLEGPHVPQQLRKEPCKLMRTRPGIYMPSR